MVAMCQQYTIEKEVRYADRYHETNIRCWGIRRVMCLFFS
jgi:hypothetical protein